MEEFEFDQMICNLADGSRDYTFFNYMNGVAAVSDIEFSVCNFLDIEQCQSLFVVDGIELDELIYKLNNI